MGFKIKPIRHRIRNCRINFLNTKYYQWLWNGNKTRRIFWLTMAEPSAYFSYLRLSVSAKLQVKSCLLKLRKARALGTWSLLTWSRWIDFTSFSRIAFRLRVSLLTHSALLYFWSWLNSILGPPNSEAAKMKKESRIDMICFFCLKSDVFSIEDCAKLIIF